MSESVRDLLNQKLAFTIDEAVQIAPIGRTSLYHAIKAGKLSVRYHGRRPIILREELARYLASLPEKTPTPA